MQLQVGLSASSRNNDTSQIAGTGARDVCMLFAFSVCEQIRLQDTACVVNAEDSSGVLGHLFHLLHFCVFFIILDTSDALAVIPI